MFARPIAVYWLIPYFAWQKIDLSDINVIINVPAVRIKQLLDSNQEDTLDGLPDNEGDHNEAELA